MAEKKSISPPVDEVRLAAESAPLVAARGGSIPDTPALAALARKHGLDLATRIFYELVCQANADFMVQVDGLPASPSDTPAGFKLILVPALLYREHPEFGGDGRAILSVARACGVDVALAPILSRGSCSENAEMIWELMKREKTERLVLLSLSKGGAEVRLALEAHRSDPQIGRFLAWVNVCGLVRGTPLLERVVAGPGVRLRKLLLSLVARVEQRALDEISSDSPRLARPFDLPSNVFVMNLIGTPLVSHIQLRNQYQRYLRLARLAPNDGFGLLPDMLVPGGVTYPLWGADHYFRTPQVSPLLYRVFHFLKGMFPPGS